jgi:type VI secretion system protein ImpA
MPLDTALIDALLAPIAGDHPSGQDLRYDPRYDQVKEARREDLELPAGGLSTERKIADWPLVIKLSRQLLEKETKDLQLAAWLAEALLRRDGLGGLATGAAGVRAVLDAFWETCYPAFDEDDPELRAGPLDWMGTKLDIPVRQSPVAPGVTLLDYQTSRLVPSEADAEANKEKRAQRAEALADGRRPPEDVDRAIGEANKVFYKALVADVEQSLHEVVELERVADARFGRDAPSFAKLRGALDETLRMAHATLAQKLLDDPDPVVEEVVDDATGTPGATDGGILTPEPVSPADAASRIGVSARYLRKLDPTNPSPYLMLRGFRWGELRAAAASGELNPKLLEAPPTSVRTRLKGLLLDGKWSELLEACETVMATPQGRGWLDLQRYALTACEQQGEAWDAVRGAVRDELRVLLAAIPQLPEMTLMDDAPTANAETQAWLAAEGLTPGAGDGTAAPAATPAQDDAGIDVVQAALAQDDTTSRHGGIRAGPRRRPVGDPFGIARQELAQGRSREAIERLLAEISREQSPRGRFLRQTQLAWLMVESGLDTVARPLLERLVSIIDERHLEEWESGPLVAQPMVLLCHVMDRAQEGGSSERYQLYLRICRLDALQAMTLQPTTG